MGNQQDLPDGYEARSLVIADSERMADCGPSLIAPAESGAGLQVARFADRLAPISHPPMGGLSVKGAW